MADPLRFDAGRLSLPDLAIPRHSYFGVPHTAECLLKEDGDVGGVLACFAYSADSTLYDTRFCGINQ